MGQAMPRALCVHGTYGVNHKDEKSGKMSTLFNKFISLNLKTANVIVGK